MMDCYQAQQIIWSDGLQTPAVTAHLDTCEACGREARRFGQLNTALANMRFDLAAPPADLQPAIMAAIPRSKMERAREVVSHPKFWRGAAVGAAAATVAAFGLIVARKMGRPDLVA